MVFLKEYLEKVDFKKISRRQKKHEKLPRRQRVKAGSTAQGFWWETIKLGNLEVENQWQP